MVSLMFILQGFDVLVIIYVTHVQIKRELPAYEMNNLWD